MGEIHHKLNQSKLNLTVGNTVIARCVGVHMCHETLGRVMALREEAYSMVIAAHSFLVSLESLVLGYTVYPRNPTGQGC